MNRSLFLRFIPSLAKYCGKVKDLLHEQVF